MKQFPVKYQVKLLSGTPEVQGFGVENLPGLAFRKVEGSYFVEHTLSGVVVGVFDKKAQAVEFIEEVGEFLEWEVGLPELVTCLNDNPLHLTYLYHRVCGFACVKPEPLPRRKRGQEVMF